MYESFLYSYISDSFDLSVLKLLQAKQHFNLPGYLAAGHKTHIQTF